MNKQSGIVAAIILITAILGAWMLLSKPRSDAPDEGGSHAEAAEIERGPHGGRVLREGDFALELAIFEEGVPPEFHVYPSSAAAAVPPQDVQLTVTTTRLDGESTAFKFAPAGDHLRAADTVIEPHSFDVAVAAVYKGKAFKWAYASYEGRTTIAATAAAEAGVKAEPAGAGTITTTATLTGRIILEPSRSAQVRPRFSGVVREVRKSLGDAVQVGDVLAVIESNESLQPFQLRAPIAGRITRRAASPGDVASGQALFEIADTSRVIAEFNAFPRHVPLLKEGQAVTVRALDGGASQDGVIDFLSTVVDPHAQTIAVHVKLDNKSGQWRPGMTVTGHVIIAARDVPLAVKNAGLQAFRDFTVVFAKVGDTYEVRMLELGDSDGVMTEILGGLKPGTLYVSENSFLIKADIEKSGASHDH